MFKRIEQFCKAQDITVTDLCRKTGINRSTLSELKKGRTKELSVKTLRKIAEFFGVTIDAFEPEKPT